jgi:EAL domain-containing protein (putative c-di-GMP-specific phosphodiesterase class I)
VVRVSDGRVISVEALLRWDHPDRGPISPSLLIPFAEELGDIIGIGEWVLERACTDRHRWEHLSGDEPFVMGVNISTHQLMAPGFVTMVKDVVDRTDTKRGQLCLEITEGVFVRDARRALEVLSRLKESGILVALDDFGTGYSSLNYLMEFPLDILKIDRSSTAGFYFSRPMTADTLDENTKCLTERSWTIEVAETVWAPGPRVEQTTSLWRHVT